MSAEQKRLLNKNKAAAINAKVDSIADAKTKESIVPRQESQSPVEQRKDADRLGKSNSASSIPEASKTAQKKVLRSRKLFDTVDIDLAQLYASGKPNIKAQPLVSFTRLVLTYESSIPRLGRYV